MSTKVRAAAVAICLLALPRRGETSEAPAKPAGVFPGKDWETRRPDDVGLDSETLRRFSVLVGGRGCVVRHGYLVHVWGDPAKRADVASACKPWFTHFLLVAIETGKVAGVDERVSRWEPGLDALNPGLGHKDREIAWKHLANQTSCYGVAERPGEAYDYDDFNMALFCDTLFLKVWKSEWTRVDDEVLRPLLTDLIGCQDRPTFLAFGPEGRPGRLGISCRDFARFGLLYLHGGEWDGKRLLDAGHVKLVTSTPVPAALPRTAAKDAEMLPGQRSLGGGKNQTEHMGSYGFAWWTNGVDRDGKRHWPDVPTDAYGAFGHGGIRAMVILPGLDLIVAWNDASVDSPEEENRALGLLVRACDRSK